jgi:hypothetical protein
VNQRHRGHLDERKNWFRIQTFDSEEEGVLREKGRRGHTNQADLSIPPLACRPEPKYQQVHKYQQTCSSLEYF